MIEMYTSANNGEEILVFPIIPKELPEIVQKYQHESFDTYEKALTIIGKRDRKIMNLELLLPCNKNYRSINSKASNNGMDYIKFWEKWGNKKVPMRLVIVDGTTEILNMAYTVDNLNYKYDRKKDIIATLELSEYVFTVDPVVDDGTQYKWEDIKISYKGKVIVVKAANVSGHWLVSVRKILELMGYTVTWNGEKKKILYGIGNDTKELNTDFKIYDGVSYGFIYKLVEELGYMSGWDAKSRTVLIDKYIYKWEKIKIVYGSKSITVSASMAHNRWLVPVRNILELMGYVVTWDYFKKEIYYSKDGKSSKLQIEYNIEQGTSYVYLYQLVEELGYMCSWDLQSRTVHIDKYIYKFEDIKVIYGDKNTNVSASMAHNRWLVPVRNILELMGYVVTWDYFKKEIYYSKDGKSSKLQTEFDIENDTVYVYLYLLCEELNVRADYDRDKKEITINE